MFLKKLSCEALFGSRQCTIESKKKRTPLVLCLFVVSKLAWKIGFATVTRSTNKHDVNIYQNFSTLFFVMFLFFGSIIIQITTNMMFVFIKTFLIGFCNVFFFLSIIIQITVKKKEKKQKNIF